MSGVAGIFMDRDGVINRPPPPELRYITRPEDFYLQPGIAESIRLFNERNLPVAVVTNQKAIAIGRLTPSNLKAIHERMKHLLAEEGAFVQDIQFCPHQESDHCTCRKPRPGMLQVAAARLHIDTRQSWIIGDQGRDLEAGRAVGCHTLLVGSAPVKADLADVQIPSTAGLPDWIRENISHFQ
jgi:D-glycero-D-manno-heptose 1,7-bisphosphate phosphatase